MVEKLCKCGEKLTLIQQYNRLYCHRCKQYPPTCPSCGRDLLWVPDYKRHYCDNCVKYQEPAKPEPPARPIRVYSPEQIQRIFNDLKERHGAGGIDDVIFAKLGRGLKFRDANGRVWAIGLESGKWYYYENEKWVEGKPPESLMP